jgi:hypothetical protein
MVLLVRRILKLHDTRYSEKQQSVSVSSVKDKLPLVTPQVLTMGIIVSIGGMIFGYDTGYEVRYNIKDFSS